MGRGGCCQCCREGSRVKRSGEAAGARLLCFSEAVGTNCMFAKAGGVVGWSGCGCGWGICGVVEVPRRVVGGGGWERRGRV